LIPWSQNKLATPVAWPVVKYREPKTIVSNAARLTIVSKYSNWQVPPILAQVCTQFSVEKPKTHSKHVGVAVGAIDGTTLGKELGEALGDAVGVAVGPADG